MIGVHIAEKGAPRLGFVEDTSIVKIYRHIAFFRYIAMKVQRCLKNGQLLLQSESSAKEKAEWAYKGRPGSHEIG